MALPSIGSERQFCERLQYDLLFRWFLDLNPDETTFDHSTFALTQVADLFFVEVVWLARNRGWVSDQHFSVDATPIESWASLKSFKPKKDDRGDGNGSADLKGEKRRNDTHQSTTDPEAKLVRKGDGCEAKLAFAGLAAMENHHGLCVLFEVTAAGGWDAEVAVQHIAELQQRGIAPRTAGAARMARLFLGLPATARQDARWARGAGGHRGNPAKRSASACSGATFTAPSVGNARAVLIRIQIINSHSENRGFLQQPVSGRNTVAF